MSKGVTRAGMQTFGDWVRQTRTGAEAKKVVSEWLESNPTETVGEFVTLPQFARWLTAKTGFKVSDSVLGRVERGIHNAPPFDVIVALSKSGLLKLPDGSPCGIEDAIAVLTEELNPVTGKRKGTLNGANAH